MFGKFIQKSKQTKSDQKNLQIVCTGDERCTITDKCCCCCYQTKCDVSSSCNECHRRASTSSERSRKFRDLERGFITLVAVSHGWDCLRKWIKLSANCEANQPISLVFRWNQQNYYYVIKLSDRIKFIRCEKK